MSIGSHEAAEWAEAELMGTDREMDHLEGEKRELGAQVKELEGRLRRSEDAVKQAEERADDCFSDMAKCEEECFDLRSERDRVQTAFLRVMDRETTDEDRELARSLRPAGFCFRCGGTGVGYDGRECMFCNGRGELLDDPEGGAT